MTVAELKTAVGKLVDQRWTKLDQDTMALLRIQRFCKEKHWQWRKKWATFNSVAGTQSYDLTATAGGSSTDFEQMGHIYRIDSTTEWTEMNPIFDPETQAGCLENTTRDDPAAYFIIEPTLYFDCPPSAADKYRYVFWATPTAALSTAIPLVPARLHFCLVSGLIMDVNEYLFGTESTKFIAAKARYDSDVALAKAEGDFTVNQSRQFVSGDAIRSTD